jgi:hypothetical protein
MEVEKQRIGQNYQDYSTERAERGKGEPKDGQQADMFLYSAAPRIADSDHAGAFFSAPAAITLTRRQSCTASITEHKASFVFSFQNTNDDPASFQK